MSSSTLLTSTLLTFAAKMAENNSKVGRTLVDFGGSKKVERVEGELTELGLN